MDPIHLNRGLLRGRALEAPRPSHVCRGTAFFIFPLEVERLSGAADLLNVVLARDTLAACPILPGREYEVTGQLRSFNDRSGPASRLVLTFFAQALSPSGEAHANRTDLAGILCKPPVLRRTPLGRDICDLLLAVNRPYGRADYLPCIAWGGAAHLCGGLAVGAPLSLTGRFQSRKYRKVTPAGETERTAYEVSILTLGGADR